MFGRIKKDIKDDVFMLRERMDHVEKELYKIQTNGVATAVNKLNKEVFEKVKETNSKFGFWCNYFSGGPLPKEPTLAAKIDAIVEYLGLKLGVEAESISVKKTKKGRK